jgi:hypothetical protein
MKKAAENLQPWASAYHRRSIGLKADANFLDFKSAFDDDPALLAAARAELVRLDHLDVSFAGKLVLRDHDQEMIRRALRGMLATYDEVKV